ncbi:MAG: hypothetical protein NVS3B16_25540 [Vulcanimicrobiaceae bacterium]
MDPKDDAEKTVRELGLTFPVGWGIDAVETARTYGCFYDENDPYVHATGFVLAPGGAIAVAAYSTGAIGRLAAQDALDLVESAKKRAAKKE